MDEKKRKEREPWIKGLVPGLVIDPSGGGWLDTGDISAADIPRSLAGKSLLETLRLELDGVDFTMLKAARSSSGTATFQYRWCQPLNSFLQFLARRLKLSAATSYHDSVKYFIFHTELGGNGRLEVRQGKHRIDLIDAGEWGANVNNS
jgi:hypothetical protein